MSEIEKKKEERKIPKKNYIKLGIIYAIVLGITFVLVFSYDSYQNYENSIAILQDVTNELNVEEFKNYQRENNDFLMYVGIPSKKESRVVEKDLLSVIEDNHLQNRIIYLNVKDDWDNFQTYFNNQYNFSIERYPAFVIFHDGKVSSLVQGSKRQALVAADIVQLLEEYEVIGK